MENLDEKDYKINKLKVEKNFMTHCSYDLQKTIIDLKDTIEFKDIKINELENKIMNELARQIYNYEKRNNIKHGLYF